MSGFYSQTGHYPLKGSGWKKSITLQSKNYSSSCSLYLWYEISNTKWAFAFYQNQCDRFISAFISDLCSEKYAQACLHYCLGFVLRKCIQTFRRHTSCWGHKTVSTWERERWGCRGGDLPFFSDDMPQTWYHLSTFQRTKTEASATRLKRRYDLWQVVANDAKPSVFCELLNHWNKKY